MLTFVIGGNKSGKSDFALRQLEEAGGRAVFLATGRARDLAFRRQIADHRDRRDPCLPVIEVGWDLPRALLAAVGEYDAILVDSLDFWLYVCAQEQHDAELVQQLLDVLDRRPKARMIMVSCEIGFAPLPGASEARSFLKKLGRLNQAIAARADEAYLVVAGLPLTLKKANDGGKQAD